MIIIASLLMGVVFGGTFDVYVSPMSFSNKVNNHDIRIRHEVDAPFYYSSMYARNAKVYNGHGGYEEAIKPRVFGEETIQYAYKGCNYKTTPLGCSIKNGHYYVETKVTFNDQQMVFRTTLYGKDGTIVNTATRTDKMIINWIKQQELIVQRSEGMLGSSTTIHKPKEEMPLKWEIPYNLFENDVQQAMLSLWLGIKMD